MTNTIEVLPKVIEEFSYKKLISRDFGDWDLYNQNFLGWKAKSWQNSCGKLDILSQAIEFKYLSIYHDIYNLGFITSGVIPENKMGFYIPFDRVSTTQGIFCGKSFDTNSLLLSRSNNQYDAFFPKDLAGWTLVIEHEFFKDYCEQVRRVELDEIINKNGSYLRVNPDQFTALKKLLKNLVAESSRNYQSLVNNHEMQVIIQAKLLDKLTEILSRQRDGIIPVSKIGSHLLAKSAREFIEAHYDQSLTIKDVCEAVGASERTLRYGFKAVFGLSPKQYLKIHRLNIAHRQLLRNNSATKSVTDIAFDAGFWHLGRFSRDYKLLFDESPLETLLKEVNTQHLLVFPQPPRYPEEDYSTSNSSLVTR